MIQEKLDYGFVNIMRKHMNPIWALEELEYLVWTVHRDEFDKLTDYEQEEIRYYLMALNLLYK